MIHRILDDIISRIKSDDLTEVYSSFDNINVEKKSAELFTVVSANNLKADNISVCGDSYFYDFHIEIEICVLADRKMSPGSIYDFFQNIIIPRVMTFGEKSSFSGFEITIPEIDYRLRRLKVSGKFRLDGTYAFERSLAN